ncbi:MAG: helix-turn-helix transcriptional regulator [Clostridia bacterium]|nr:helix-turn-helix transcriptional regulator [Clostridia bacterium]
MSFGKTIKRLRRERDMTQDELAEILSISPQAVSRWETDAAMPDISLIAPLCNLFHVTADSLLEIDVSRQQEEIWKICSEASKYSDRGYLSEARQILEDGLRRYPDSLDLAESLMFVSYWQHRASPTEQSYLDEAIRLGEKILEKSTNDYTRHSAVQILCFTYSDSGETNKAIKLAYTMPPISVSQESLLAAIQKGDDGYRAKQCEMYNLLQFLSNELANIQMTLGSGEKAYTEEECAALRDKQIALLNLFYENGDFSFYHTHLCEAHREQAAYYARIGNSEQTLSHLEKAAEHAIKFIIYSEKGEESTSLVFRGMLPCIWSADETDNDAAKVLNLMESSDFDFVRETRAFGKIKARLSEYAGKWEVK